MMTMTPTGIDGKQQLTFEDLRGLRAEGYIRNSTLDQKDGYGPDLQRKAIETFASAHGPSLGDEFTGHLFQTPSSGLCYGWALHSWRKTATGAHLGGRGPLGARAGRCTRSTLSTLNR